MGLSEGHMAWLLGITRLQYRDLEAGRLHITNDLYEGIVKGAGGRASEGGIDPRGTWPPTGHPDGVFVLSVISAGVGCCRHVARGHPSE